jgi:hypothetical protein
MITCFPPLLDRAASTAIEHHRVLILPRQRLHPGIAIFQGGKRAFIEKYRHASGRMDLARVTLSLGQAEGTRMRS